MSSVSIPSAAPATTQPTAPTLQKRPIEDLETQHVGPTGSSHTQQENAPDSGERRSRPVFKMRRTGHSGPFPFTARPVQPPVAVGGTGKHDTPSPSISSSAPSPRIPDAGPALDLLPESSKVLRELEKPMHLDNTGILTPTDANDAGPSHAQTQAKMTIGRETHGKPMNSRQSLPFSDPGASGSSNYQDNLKSGGNENMKATIPPDVQKVFDSALDDRPYKTWTDESGKALATAGALLPPGYQKSDDPYFPWLCPVRSCRKMLPTLHGLGKHFCNSHRATILNDNMDGTLTDLGRYASHIHGDGKSSGGFAKPCVIVSKKAMSLAEAPMVQPGLHYRAAHSGAQSRSSPTVPQRGGPRRSSALFKAALEESDSDIDYEPRARVRRAADTPQGAASDASESRMLDMANPDRPYNLWRDSNGEFVFMGEALIPDGYKHDTTLPDRPWICPVRSCRRLFKSALDLGNHFRGHHRGSRLNDNLDGTLSVLGTKNGATPAVVVSRNPMDSEPIVEPTRPTYPYPQSSKVVWVKATDDDPSPASLPVEADATDDVPDVELERTVENRPYNKWWDDNGELVSMAGALIPQGYQLDLYTFEDRPWICPIRTCRVACKFKNGLGYHFMTVHRSCSLNDNGNGTFSIIGTHNGKAAHVVSQNPLDPDEPPAGPVCLPPNTEEARAAQRAKSAAAALEATSSIGVKKPVVVSDITSGGSDEVWDHISSRVAVQPTDRETPEAAALLGHSKMRELTIVAPSLLVDDNPRRVPSLLLQVVGVQNSNPCTECRRQNGPFDTCVNASADLLRQLYPFMGSAAQACANCIARKNPGRCSVRKMHPAVPRKEPRVFQGRVEAEVSEVSGDDSGDEGKATDIASVRRRSTRLSLANGNVDSDEEDEEMPDVTPPEPEPRASRLVSLKVPSSAQNVRQLRERRAVSYKVSAPAEKEFHLEDWEMGDGRVDTAGEPLAFSSSYLAANQTVQVSSNINFQALSIPSGRVHQIPADSSRTRICSLSSGKLAVQVGKDDFVIGSQGIFKIAPGVACTVTNKCYADVVLHVTSVNEA